MARQSVAYRLVSEGKAQLINDFREIGDSGDKSARSIGRAFERDAAAAEKAIEKLEATAAKVAMALPNAAGATNTANPVFRSTYGAVDNGAAFDAGGMRSAQTSAAALFAEQDRLIAQRNVILAQVDPLFAAQLQYNAAIDTATELRRREILTEEQYILVERQAMEALNDAVRTQASGGVSMGQLRAGTQQLGYQFQDLGVQLAMAASSGDVFKGSVMAITMQAPQVVSAIGLMKGEAGGLIGLLQTPWAAAFMAAASVAAILGAQMLTNADADKEAEKAAKDHEQAVKSLREQLKSAVQSAEDRARATYMEAESQREAEVATRNRTQALLDLAKADLEYRVSQTRGPGTARSDVSAQGIGGAQAELTRLEGLLAQSQASVTAAELAANRARGLYQGEILSAMDTPADRARRRYRQQETALYEVGGNPEKVARDLQKLRAARDAELKSIEDAQKAVRESAKTRSDGANATASQVGKNIADELGVTVTSTTGGKHVKNSYHYRNQAIDFVPKGGMQAMSKADVRAWAEAQGLTILELLGPGDKGHSDHYHLAWEGGRFDGRAGKSATERQDDRSKALGTAIGMDGVGVIAKEEQAAIDAVTEAQKKLAAAEKDRAERANDFFKRTAQGQAEDMESLMLKQQLMAANDNLADAELSKLRLIQDARREGVDIQSAEFQALLAGNDALEERRRLLDEQTALWEETRAFGARAIDTLFDISSAQSWGDRVKSILTDLVQEMLMLAAINPLKNSLFGTSLPTLGSGGIGGFLKGLVGGSSGGGTTSQVIPTSYGLNAGFAATGTEYTSGGAMWLAENGPELVSLPRGARVTSAADTRRLLAGNDNGPRQMNVYQTIQVSGAVDLVRMEHVEPLANAIKQETLAAMGDTTRRAA